MSPLRAAGWVGAGMAMGAVTADVGAPPLRNVLDPVVWVVYAGIGGMGAFTGISMVLAWRHARESRRWLLATLIGLLLLSMPDVSSFLRERREMRRFLATAAWTQGLVADKYYRGTVHLIVEYRADGQLYRVRKWGLNPMLGTPEYSRWERGDSIPVYYQPNAPRLVRVGHRGPELRILLESLAKVWSVWGVLLTAYLPLIVRPLRRELLVLRGRLHRDRG
jgi:hypothetical protein